jgi:hypothetical protein
MATAHVPWHFREHPSPTTLKFAFIALALSAISGVIVFCLLCARDNRSMQNLSSAVISPQRAALNTPPAVRPSYDRFTLSRTVRRVHQVGPVKLGLRRIYAKRGFCDLSIVVDGHGITERHIATNHPLWITVPGKSSPLELIVTHIAKRHVSGYVRSVANG